MVASDCCGFADVMVVGDAETEGTGYCVSLILRDLTLGVTYFGSVRLK